MKRIKLAMWVMYGLVLTLVGMIVPPSEYPSAYAGPVLSVSQPARELDARCITTRYYIGWPYTVAGGKNNSCETWGARYDEFYPLSLFYYFITGTVIYFVADKISKVKRSAKI
ncbi:MAG: hypothetical protein WBB39_00595 [Candidatus Saccharimonadales bacterium]